MSRTSDKLEEEIIEEAKEEDNLQEESGNKRSFFSFGRKKEEVDEEVSEDESDEDDVKEEKSHFWSRSKDDADEESSRVYLVSVDWSEDCKPVFSSNEPYLISHDYSEHYIIEAEPWCTPSDKSVPASPEEQAIFMDIAEHFYDFEKEYDPNTDDYTSYTAGNWTACWFMAYINGDKCTFVLHQPEKPEAVYSYKKDGLVKFQKNMIVPSKGHFVTTMYK